MTRKSMWLEAEIEQQGKDKRDEKCKKKIGQRRNDEHEKEMKTQADKKR